MLNPNCPHCKGTGWVCEEHSDQPMNHDGCMGAGMPCHLCYEAGEFPGLPNDFDADRETVLAFVARLKSKPVKTEADLLLIQVLEESMGKQ